MLVVSSPRKIRGIMAPIPSCGSPKLRSPSSVVRPQSPLVITFALHVLRLLPFLIGGHRQLALENPALRQHLAVYKRTTPHQAGRLFWAALARVGPGGGRHWFIVTPAIVLRWQRRRFRDYWTRLSCRPTAGRPSLDAEIAAANPLWGARASTVSS